MGHRRTFSGAHRRKARVKREAVARGATELVAQLDAAIARNRSAATAPVIEHNATTRGELVHAIVSRYGRRRGYGSQPDKLMRCEASRREVLGAVSNLGAEGKVIYDSVAVAERAALALAAAGLGKVYAYPCARSSSGHAHLTSSPPEAQPARLRAIGESVARWSS